MVVGGPQSGKNTLFDVHVILQEMNTVATASMSQTEAQHRAKLAKIKHEHYLAKRKNQLARMAVRIDLLLHRAQDLPAATKADLAAKLGAFKHEAAAVMAATGVTEKAHREAATAAWKALRASFETAYEQAGLADVKKAKKAAKA